ncbi:helix-turn-helix domain-containing protein [Pseudoduganella sp. UC29_106]|uniref:helix-turn-helix domain-containing protein n=1 Tax=Pseudoduganella sp. UC29_106 TaxID=3374553 RepID=UPI003756AD7F
MGSLPVTRWSTDDVPALQRLDYYAAALSTAIVPAQLAAPGADHFAAHMDALELGGLSCIRQQGSAHRCFTDSGDIARSSGRNFHLILNRETSWNVEHRGRMRMERGDALFVDSQFVVDFDSPSDYDYLHLKLSEGWVRQWLPSPSALTGARISSATAWGRALIAYAAAMTPQFLQQSPLPLSLIVDQLGSLLALTAQEMSGAPAEKQKPALPQIDRIRDAMWQLCCSPALTASDVATAVGMPLRTFHRCFTRSGTTFGRTLTDMRCTNAVRMLQSPLYKRLTIGEIAFRAGFCDASHLSAVVHSRTGHTPSQIRRTGDSGARTNSEEQV